MSHYAPTHMLFAVPSFHSQKAPKDHFVQGHCLVLLDSNPVMLF